MWKGVLSESFNGYNKEILSPSFKGWGIEGEEVEEGYKKED